MLSLDDHLVAPFHLFKLFESFINTFLNGCICPVDDLEAPSQAKGRKAHDSQEEAPLPDATMTVRDVAH